MHDVGQSVREVGVNNDNLGAEVSEQLAKSDVSQEDPAYENRPLEKPGCNESTTDPQRLYAASTEITDVLKELINSVEELTQKKEKIEFQAIASNLLLELSFTKRIHVPDTKHAELINVKEDGDCGFAATMRSHQRNIGAKKNKVLRFLPNMIVKLREQIVGLMVTDEGSQYSTSWEITKNPDLDASFGEYCTRMYNGHAYCDETCVKALSNYYERKILVMHIHYDEHIVTSYRWEVAPRYFPKNMGDHEGHGLVLFLCGYKYSDPHYIGVANAT